MPKPLLGLIEALEPLPYEYAALLKFEERGEEIKVLDFVLPLQAVTRNSFEILDLRPVPEGFEGVLHRHLSCEDFSPRDETLLRAYPLNLLVRGSELVKVVFKGKAYGVKK